MMTRNFCYCYLYGDLLLFHTILLILYRFHVKPFQVFSTDYAYFVQTVIRELVKKIIQ